MCDDTKDEEDEVDDEVPNTGDLKAAMAGLLRLLVGRRDGGRGGRGVALRCVGDERGGRGGVWGGDGESGDETIRLSHPGGGGCGCPAPSPGVRNPVPWNLQTNDVAKRSLVRQIYTVPTGRRKREAARSQSPLPSPPLAFPLLRGDTTTRQEQNRSSLLSLRETARVYLPSSGISSIRAWPTPGPRFRSPPPPGPLAAWAGGVFFILSYLHWGYILGGTI